MENRFKIECLDGRARRGSFCTASGTFQTPAFMPVGTKGTVKGIDSERLRESGAEVMLVNTYHLWLRPEPEVVAALGGIHRFASWEGPILSDSGGYQVFSLRGIRTLTEQGVEFRSHLDGARKFLSPEISISIQETLGVDIAMVLDECPPADYDRAAVERSLELTLRWAARSLAARRNQATAIFGITQGGKYPELRQRAAEVIGAMEFDGVAVGGLSVGEGKEVTYEVLSYHVQQLPADKIHYLMGVGTPLDICTAVREGIDLFDCVMPTRAGRFGRAFVAGHEPYINIRNAQYARDPQALDSECGCVACRRYSRGYLHHLFKAGEMLGPQLLSVHNTTHYQRLMQKIRESITAGQFEALYRKERERWEGVEAA